MWQILKKISFVFILSMFIFSCKEADVYKVNISVVDYTTKLPKEGVHVESTVFIENPTKELLDDIEQTKKSDAEGKVSFEFKHEANIHFKLAVQEEGKFGKADIKLEANETIERLIYIYPTE
ncbi:MAG: hypothetical protein N4A45_07990 [Flavobacteriales bacterium]|jgi:hypothetical protein|nr:hypothetical protein [Flavobacteriales bacterium]